MPSTINIWEEADMANCAQTGGTWSYTGSITPAPTAPLTYNGTADFSGITTAGDYEFTYTVGTHSSVYTVTYGSSAPRVNDVCLTAKYISIPTPPYDIIYSDYNNAVCPGYDYPTSSGEAIPPNWIYGVTYYDMWYYFEAPAMSCNYNIEVEVTGLPYAAGGVQSPAIAVYKDSGTDCSTKVLLGSVEENGPQNAILNVPITAYSGGRIWIRMASEVAGNFDIYITASTPSGCTQVTSPAVNVWGFEPIEVFGDATSEVWGY